MSDTARYPNLYIYESEIRVILEEAELHPGRETGGDLYGSFTHSDMPVVWLASGPGPGAQGRYAEFQQDAAFTTERQKRLHQRFGVQYIGGWHSHHSLGLNRPSSGDIRVAREYATRHNRRRNVEIIVTLNPSGKAVLWPYFYFNAPDSQYSFATLVALEGESPLRSKIGPEEAFFSRANTRSHGKPTEEEVPEEASSHGWFHLGKLETGGPGFPEVLNEEIDCLYRAGFQDLTIEQRDNLFLVSISLNGRVLAVVLETYRWPRAVKVKQINVIDKETDTNNDIEVLAGGRLRVKGKKLQGQTLVEVFGEIMHMGLTLVRA